MLSILQQQIPTNIPLFYVFWEYCITTKIPIFILTSVHFVTINIPLFMPSVIVVVADYILSRKMCVEQLHYFRLAHQTCE